MIHVQIDTLPWRSMGLFCSKLTSDYLIFIMVAMNQFFLSFGNQFFLLVTIDFSSFPWQPSFFILLCY